MMPLKFIGNFWRTLKMSLINCGINLILTWSANLVVSNAATNENTTFSLTDTKPYVPDVPLSIQDHAKLLQRLKPGFKRTINWNKYHSKTEPLNASNPYLDFLIDPSFYGVNRLFVLQLMPLIIKQDTQDIIF